MTRIDKTKVRKIGNSLGIIIPHRIVDAYNLHKGDLMGIKMDSNCGGMNLGYFEGMSEQTIEEQVDRQEIFNQWKKEAKEFYNKRNEHK